MSQAPPERGEGPRKRGPYRKTEQRKAEIIAAALAAYAEADARGPSLRTIGERVGVSEQVIQHHFTTKDELFVSILHDRDEKAVESYRSRTHRGGELDLVDIMRQNEHEPGLVRLYADLYTAAADEEHPAHDFFRNRLAVATAGVAEYFARQRTGDPDAEVTDRDSLLARLTLAAADGLQARWLVDPSEDAPGDLERLIDVLTGFNAD